MAHTTKDKKKLINRVKRIRGQIGAIERMIESEDTDCSAILQMIASCRGAINGLMAETIEGHISHHVLAEDSKPTRSQIEAARDLIKVVNTYLK